MNVSDRVASKPGGPAPPANQVTRLCHDSFLDHDGLKEEFQMEAILPGIALVVFIAVALQILLPVLGK